MDVIATSDFAVFWEIGRAILAGLSPYSVGGSWYPPAGSLLFALTALAPLGIGYFIMLGLNALAALSIIRRYGKLWLAYVPLVFVMLAGQVDLILAAFIPWLNEKGWKPVAAAILLSLKPITAITILPWFMIQWAIKDRPTLFKTLGIGGAIHLAPILIRPTILKEWISVILESGTGHYAGGVGIWLASTWIPTWFLILTAVFAVILALRSRNENLSRALLTLASPFAMPYHLVMLTGTAPATILVPTSIFATAILSTTFIQPYRALIPLAVVAYYAISKLTIYARTSSISLHGGAYADHHQGN